jgi:hypothetical protein
LTYARGMREMPLSERLLALVCSFGLGRAIRVFRTGVDTDFPDSLGEGGRLCANGEFALGIATSLEHCIVDKKRISESGDTGPVLDYTVGLYLLHERDRQPDAAKLKRAATGGRTHLIAAQPPAVN